MKILFHRLLTTAASIMFSVVCLGQELRITSFDTSGQMDFTLSPTGTVADYSCWIEWSTTLHDAWTNAWHRPFALFPETNGAFVAALPHFFRILGTTGAVQTTGGDGWTNYTVTAVISARIEDGFVNWTNGGDTGIVYYVEHATSTNGNWSGRWDYQTNIHATSAVTNFFSLPMFFRVVAITPYDGGEVPP